MEQTIFKLNDIYKGDCFECMRNLPDKSVDCVITDPPYNVNLDYDVHEDDKTEEEYKEFCIRLFYEVKRICKKTFLITPGINNLHIWLGIQNPKCIISWYKPNSVSRNYCMGINTWEPILYYTFSEVIKHRVPIDYMSFLVTFERGVEWHPCPKPLKLMRKLVGDYSNQGDIILDMFAGSGTVLLACKQLGRNYLGFELSEYYVQKIKERLSQELLIKFNGFENYEINKTEDVYVKEAIEVENDVNRPE